MKQTIKTEMTKTEALKYMETLSNEAKEYAKLFYLDYINNYLTLDRMCEDYYISVNEANNWYIIGKELSN